MKFAIAEAYNSKNNSLSVNTVINTKNSGKDFHRLDIVIYWEDRRNCGLKKMILYLQLGKFTVYVLFLKVDVAAAMHFLPLL